MEKKSVGILIALLILAALLIIIFDRPNKPAPIACTDDAMVCPDGTAVGRTGPNCEFAACPNTPEPSTPSSPKTSSFDAEIELSKGQVVLFPDGLRVQLKSINDSRCPADVTCVWQGEVAGTFILSGGKLSKSAEVTISTSTKPEVSTDSYRLLFVSGTEGKVRFIVGSSKKSATGGCYIGGCSSQICSDQKDVVSTCEYREAYACYKTAVCERQTSGQCGWTETSELKACLRNAR